MEAFRGKRMLVVGGGDSAIESAVGLAAQGGTEVVLSHRGSDFRRAKPRNIAKLEEIERSGSVRFLRESVVTSIERDSVQLEVGGETRALPIDYVVVRIGGEPPSRFLERVGIRSVVKELPLEEARDAVGV
jgi:thioredoxin reductase